MASRLAVAAEGRGLRLPALADAKLHGVERELEEEVTRDVVWLAPFPFWAARADRQSFLILYIHNSRHQTRTLLAATLSCRPRSFQSCLTLRPLVQDKPP